MQLVSCLVCWNGPDDDVKASPQKPILLQGHERSITQIKYNREGDLLFSVAKDTVSNNADTAFPYGNVFRDDVNRISLLWFLPLKVANVWYSVNGERLGTYNGHTGAVWCVDCDCILSQNTPGMFICNWRFEFACKDVYSGVGWCFFNMPTLRGHQKCVDGVSRQQLSALGLWDRYVQIYWVLASNVVYLRFLELCLAVQVNSWPCSKPTRLSGPAALISAATSSCSPQISRWVTSASWTSSTWGIHSKLVHITPCRYLKMMYYHLFSVWYSNVKSCEGSTTILIPGRR